MTKEKRLYIAMLLGAAITILFAVFTDFSAQCAELCGTAFRFHILANSDSAADQQIKTGLRDRILSEFGEVFGGCRDKSAAVRAAERSMPLIEQCANEYLEANGCGYRAVCSIENSHFPIRMYGSYTLPSGNYDALKITLGSGEGHNWWCVLFPSVCLDAAAVKTDAFPKRTFYEKKKLSNQMTADSLAAEHGKIEFRFALYDWLCGIFGK